MSEWQSIESAPRDRMLLCFTGAEIVPLIWYDHEKRFVNVWCASYNQQPTHWMEMPSVPFVEGDTRWEHPIYGTFFSPASFNEAFAKFAIKLAQLRRQKS